MLEPVIVQLSDPPPAPRYRAGPPHRSVPEEARGGMRGSDKQLQVEPQCYWCGNMHPKTAGAKIKRGLNQSAWIGVLCYTVINTK